MKNLFIATTSIAGYLVFALALSLTFAAGTTTVAISRSMPRAGAADTGLVVNLGEKRNTAFE
jgi:hypothetical protein